MILPAAPKRQQDPQTSKSRQTGKLARQHGNITDQELSEHMPTIPSLQQTTKQLSKGKVSSRFVFTSDVSHRSEENIVILPAAPKRQADPQTSKSRQTGKLARQHGNITDQELSEHMPTIPSLQQTTKQLSKGKVSSRFVFTSDVSHGSEENIVILPAAPKQQADPQTSKSRQTGKLARQHGNITDQELSEHMPTIPSLQQTTKQLSKGKVSSRFVFTSDVSHRSEENIVILPAAPKPQEDSQTSKSRQTGKLARQHGNITD